jgi:serine/threonine-protein kinase RsbW
VPERDGVEPAGDHAETVHVTIPADPSYVSVLRTVTASLAARRDFTIEEIDDLRIAVDEACALLLPHAAVEVPLSATFGGAEDTLSIRVTVPVEADPATVKIDQASFAWMVLSALADAVTTEVSADALTLTLSKTRLARL